MESWMTHDARVVTLVEMERSNFTDKAGSPDDVECEIQNGKVHIEPVRTT